MADATITVTISEVADEFDAGAVETYFKRVLTELPNNELGRKNEGYDVQVKVK